MIAMDPNREIIKLRRETRRLARNAREAAAKPRERPARGPNVRRTELNHALHQLDKVDKKLPPKSEEARTAQLKQMSVQVKARCPEYGPSIYTEDEYERLLEVQALQRKVGERASEEAEREARREEHLP